MDARQVIARFEAERQTLTLPDHPNVAQVYDAGITEAARPYFVMEYGKGVPITGHCDQFIPILGANFLLNNQRAYKMPTRRPCSGRKDKKPPCAGSVRVPEILNYAMEN